MDWSKLRDVTDWSDLSKMMEAGTEEQKSDNSSHKESKPQSSSNGSQSTKNDKDNEELKKLNEPVDKTADDEKVSLDDKVGVGDWTDMKQFDDDHDPDWFEQEEDRLAETYGGHFIKVKYTEQGNAGYFCKLCLVEMNAKKSLDAHCEGMKHLKKKSMFEKSQSGETEAEKKSEVLDGGWNDDSKPRKADKMDRDRSPIKLNQGSFDRKGDRDFGRNNRNDRGDRNNRGQRDRDNRSGFREGRDRNDRFDSRNGRFDGRNDRFDGRNDGFDQSRENAYDRHNAPRGTRDEPHRRDNQYGRSDDNSRHDNLHGRSGDQNERFGNRNNSCDGPRDPYNRNNLGPLPSAPSIPSGPTNVNSSENAARIVQAKEKLSGGTTGILLSKLASCYIKDENDADLALDVITSLSSSLREYNTKNGEKKIAELLMEAELKMNTLKALKVGLKLLKKPNQDIFGSASLGPTASMAPPPPSFQQQSPAYSQQGGVCGVPGVGGGYGAPSGSGGYGAPSGGGGGGYGAPAGGGGGYGSPAGGGGYGAPPGGGDGGGYGAPYGGHGYGGPPSDGGYGTPRDSGSYRGYGRGY